MSLALLRHTAHGSSIDLSEAFKPFLLLINFLMPESSSITMLSAALLKAAATIYANESAIAKKDALFMLVKFEAVALAIPQYDKNAKPSYLWVKLPCNASTLTLNDVHLLKWSKHHKRNRNHRSASLRSQSFNQFGQSAGYIKKCTIMQGELQHGKLTIKVCKMQSILALV